MKKLTLNQAWKLCLKLWYWVIKEWRKDKTKSIVLLKKEWMKNNGYEEYEVLYDCFFCEFAYQKEKSYVLKCNNCPARLLDSHFGCENVSCNWRFEPEKFYKKILKLNEKRIRNEITNQ